MLQHSRPKFVPWIAAAGDLQYMQNNADIFHHFLGEMPYVKLLHLVILKEVQFESNPLDISGSHFML